MYKTGDSTIEMETVVDFVLLFAFIALVVSGIYYRSESAVTYADYYTKEISRLVNFAKPGDSFTVDIQDATRIARKNGVSSDSEIVSFKNSENAVCFKLSVGRETCYHYFNEVDVVNWKIERGVPINLLTFQVIEKQKTSEDIIEGQNEAIV